MTDMLKYLIPVIIFLGFISLMSVMIGESIYESDLQFRPANNTNLSITTHTNLQPPECVYGGIPIIDDLGCVFAYIGYFSSLMTINSDYQWLFFLVLVPILVIIGYIMVDLLLRGIRGA